MAGLFGGRTRRRAAPADPPPPRPEQAQEVPAQAEPVSGPPVPASGLPATTDVDAVLAAEAAIAAAANPRTGPARLAYGLGRELVRGAATAFLTAHVSLFAWSIFPMIFGWTPSVVISGSMEPAISVGDIVFYAPEKPETLAEGRVILFRSADGRLFSHRLHQRRGDGTFITQGDANASADAAPVRPEQVKGAARLIIPHIGVFAMWDADHREAAIVWSSMAALSILLSRSGAQPQKERPGRRRRGKGGPA